MKTCTVCGEKVYRLERGALLAWVTHVGSDGICCQGTAYPHQVRKHYEEDSP